MVPELHLFKKYTTKWTKSGFYYHVKTYQIVRINVTIYME